MYWIFIPVTDVSV